MVPKLFGTQTHPVNPGTLMIHQTHYWHTSQEAQFACQQSGIPFRYLLDTVHYGGVVFKWVVQQLPVEFPLI